MTTDPNASSEITAADLRPGDRIVAGLNGPTVTIRNAWKWQDPWEWNVSYDAVELYGTVTVSPQTTFQLVRRAS